MAEDAGAGPASLFRDESLAPAVDRELLVALVARKLPDEQARAVYALIHTFRSWSAAHARILVEEFHRGQPEAPRP